MKALRGLKREAKLGLFDHLSLGRHVYQAGNKDGFVHIGFETISCRSVETALSHLFGKPFADLIFNPLMLQQPRKLTRGALLAQLSPFVSQCPGLHLMLCSGCMP